MLVNIIVPFPSSRPQFVCLYCRILSKSDAIALSVCDDKI